jgi:nitroimidazol reductase NimA-like FMN-containing flavoprotein (pyridoxamine 5'-phosphate oxidase superfamily)
MNTPEEQAKEIISKILYITIATFSRHRKPWITPVYSAYDENYNFYWISGKSTEHSQNVRANNEVAIVIYDSTVLEGMGKGVYMEALVYELEDEKEIAEALACLYDRKNKPPRDAYDFVDNSPCRVYKAVPQKVWMNIAEKTGSHVMHGRVEIKLLNNEGVI